MSGKLVVPQHGGHVSITRGRTKPKMTEAQRYAGRRLARARDVPVGSGVSWWTAYCTGDRRDGAYQAEADRRCAGTVTRRQMGPALTPWADS